MNEGCQKAKRSARHVGGRLRSLAAIGAVSFQLGVFLLLIWLYSIESPAFLRVTALAFAGAAVHYLLPARWRLGFFAALSLASVGLVFGAAAGAWLVGLGFTLIALCHLPLPFSARAAILVLAAGGLTLLRGDFVPAPVPAAIWPILGSMFMFRMIVYLYDLKHRAAPFGVARSLAYFFMLPNVCFPLFPVVDYKTFCRTTANDRALRIVQNGAEWIWRGIFQLLLYRLVYQSGTLAPGEITGSGDLFRSMAATYALYLRVSGQFHLVIGMLHLFGFNLPETNHRYFLASSFTDFWRRINIYWRDFIMKVVFYPTFFRMKRRGQTYAMIVATACAFLLTWLLHSYQWFWVRRSFPVTIQDVLFWSALGALVLANVLWEARFGRRRTLSKKAWTPGAHAALAGRTVATFLTITLLWSLWTSDSLAEWWALMSHFGHIGPRDLAWIGGLLGGVAGAAVLMGRSTREWTERAKAAGGAGSGPDAAFWRSALRVGALATLVLLAGVTRVNSRFDPRVEAVLHSLRWPTLNTRDTEKLQRGYYEDLVNVSRFNEELGQVFSQKPADWKDFIDTSIQRPTGDFMFKELVPGSSDTFNGVTHSVNRWGMRDRDYTREKPNGMRRIVMLGASRVMGWGVGDGETFENLIEERMAREAPPGAPPVEILNFAVNGYDSIQKMLHFERHALAFGPDVVLYGAHAQEMQWCLNRVVSCVTQGIPLPDSFLEDVARRAGLERGMPEVLAKGRLKPYAPEIVAWSYARLVAGCRAAGALPFWYIVPEIRSRGTRGRQYRELTELARQAGFMMLDITDAYGNIPSGELEIAAWDDHPGPRAHQLLAAALQRALAAEPRFAEAIGRGKETP